MSEPITNDQILALVKKALAVLVVKDRNRFRILAYQNVIESIKSLDEELYTIAKRGKLAEIPGVGTEFSGKLSDIIETGSTPEWEKLYQSVPQGMFPLLDIPGIGPKRAFHLAKTFNLTDTKTAVTRLKKAAHNGKISELEGFGPVLEKKILIDIDRIKPKIVRMRLDQAEAIADRVISILKGMPEVTEVTVLGSIRRREETVGDVDIGVATNEPDIITEKLKANTSEIHKVEAAGSNVVRLSLYGNKQADIKFQHPNKFGATIQHFTGSKFHNIALREYALSLGMSLSEHGIKSDSSLQSYQDETSFYHALGLPYIPPELRQNTGEIEAARNNALPVLVGLKDVRGDFHTHTDFTWRSSHDYGDSISALCTKANELGYEWLSLGDHNPSRTSYNTKQMVQVLKDRDDYIEAEFEKWQKIYPDQLKIFKTLEVDILPDGSLAIPDQAIELLDYIIVSIHSNLSLDIDQQTARLLKALSFPKVKILGHPTGRLMQQELRSGLNAHWQEIYTYSQQKDIALEINAQPMRLDLPDTMVKEAYHQGIKIAIGTDAHQAKDLTYMRYGIDVARRGWVAKGGIINTYSYQDVKLWLQQ